jgi:hypothetical protein
LFFAFARSVFADDKFSNSFGITYQINSSGVANISEDITITNKSSEYYPSKQTFTYHYLNLGNIKVIDEQGEFEPEIKKDGNTTNVTVVFRTQNAGIGKQTKFRLLYQTSDIVSLNGEVWQILIPGIKNLDFYDNFQLNLLLPSNFPEIQYASVEPRVRWQWGKDEIKDRGIVLIFGKMQYYSLQLDYSLKNNGLSGILDSITIPPDTNYQKIILQSISEEPAYSEEDSDGNWILWFELGPSTTKKIQAKLLARLTFEPETSPVLSKDQIKIFTRTTRFWDYEKMASFASKQNNLTSAKQVYDYTVATLTYNLNRLGKTPERFSASQALQNPINSICTDFTNVFISLARKNNIPAREVDGYAQTSSTELQPLSLEKDVLHAWPEYYDFKNKKWIMVDPTWEKTTGGIDYFHKLDLNHIAFVKKGVSSEIPAPPGSYKTDDLNTKDVNVTFARAVDWESEALKQKDNHKIDLIYEANDYYISGLDQSGKIIIQNKSGEAIENVPIFFKIDGKSYDKEISRLIPFQIYEFKFSFPRINFWERKTVTLITLINNKSFKKDVNFTPIFFWQNNIYYFCAGATIILIIITLMIYTIYRSLARRTKI